MRNNNLTRRHSEAGHVDPFEKEWEDLTENKLKLWKVIALLLSLWQVLVLIGHGFWVVEVWLWNLL